MKPPLQKLFLVAVYTSPVIGLLIITPIFMANHYFLGLYTFVVAKSSFFIFLTWMANILVTLLAYKWKLIRKLRYIVSYLLCIVFLPLFIVILSPVVRNEGFHQAFHFHLIVFSAINTVIIIVQDLILLREKNTIIELENAQLKMKNLEAVNEQLKQQIHPHFLFNSLSTLKTLITSSPENAQAYLVKLSDFLRKSISSNTLNTIKVAEELRSCIDYLEMQQIRFGQALQFSIDVPANIRDEYWLPVFSIQVLVENAIKHNAFTMQAPLFINIDYNETFIIVSNSVQPKNIAETSAGIGLTNLNERYRILSGENIIIKSDENTFSVSLKVFDNENSDH